MSFGTATLSDPGLLYRAQQTPEIRPRLRAVKTAWISQPCYLSWPGWYASLDRADVCVLLDIVQFSHQSWQQRNRVRGRDGRLVWLTVPAHAPLGTRLDQVEIVDNRWQRKHWATLTQAYSRAPGWQPLAARLEPIYNQPWDRLADLNEALIRQTAAHLGIQTPIIRASELAPTRSDRIERLEDLLAEVQADTLIEPAAGSYLEDAPFRVEWFDYEPVEYPQGGMEWCSHLSIVDLLAYHGDSSLGILRGTVVSGS